MNKTIKGLAFAAMLALSLVASTSGALAKDAKAGRETAWTDPGPLPIPQGVTWEAAPLEPVGVTWEE
ncbi:MAG TPA: hypothetical protein VJ260_11185 [Vicinamibacterales bacterium]|jgi:hypothetical protein|nr:hypothetical protein [Vicinamibacterales bacterium]